MAGSGNLRPGVGGRALGSVVIVLVLVLVVIVLGRVAMDLMPELVGVDSEHGAVDKTSHAWVRFCEATVHGDEDAVLSFGELCELGLVKTITLVHSIDGDRILVAGVLGLVLRSADQVHLPDVFSVRLNFPSGISALEGPLERDTSAHNFLVIGLDAVGGWIGLDSGSAWHASVVNDSEGRGIAYGGRGPRVGSSARIHHGDSDIVGADHSWVKVGRVETIGRVSGSGGV